MGRAAMVRKCEITLAPAHKLAHCGPVACHHRLIMVWAPPKGAETPDRIVRLSLSPPALRVAYERNNPTIS